MSRCSACGGTREQNILRHREGCEFHRSTDLAAVEVAAGGRRAELAVHPDLLDLDVALDFYYPR